MQIISDDASFARTFELPIDPRLKQLLVERRDQLGGDIGGHARFIIAQSDDSLQALEAELGFPILSNPELSFGCEWVADHGTLFEAVWILTDDGFAHVAFITKKGTDPDLLKFCELHITAPV